MFLNAPGGGKRCEAIGKLVDSGQEQPTALHVEKELSIGAADRGLCLLGAFDRALMAVSDATLLSPMVPAAPGEPTGLC